MMITWRAAVRPFPPAGGKLLTSRPQVASLVAGTDLDLDHTVTEKTLGGVFALLAEEEKRIRTDSVARTTDLLKKGFGQ